MDINTNDVSQVNIKERTCQQMLGIFLINVGILNALEIILKVVLRLIFPDNTLAISGYEVYIGIIRLIIVIILFINFMIKMKPYDTHSPHVRKLLVLWGVILIPIQLINDVCVMLYTRMLELIYQVFAASNADPDGKIFALVYDSTHGFKYICILLAILLGIVMTGEILEKRKLMLFSGVTAVMFLVAFALLRMDSLDINKFTTFEIGLNWASMVFHALNTIGLFSIGLYIVLTFKPETDSNKEN